MGDFIIHAYWQTYFRIRAHEAFKNRAPYRTQDSLCPSTSVEALCWHLSEPGILSRKCKMRSLQAKSATVPLWLEGDLGGNSSPVEVSWSFAIDFHGANIPLMQTFHNNLLCRTFNTCMLFSLQINKIFLKWTPSCIHYARK